MWSGLLLTLRVGRREEGMGGPQASPLELVLGTISGKTFSPMRTVTGWESSGTQRIGFLLSILPVNLGYHLGQGLQYHLLP